MSIFFNQQMCCLSGWSGEVCRGLVQDYFQLTPSAPPHFAAALRALPTMAPLFTANLITTLSQLYAKIGKVQVLPQLSTDQQGQWSCGISLHKHLQC